jgi:hypothetical protein
MSPRRIKNALGGGNLDHALQETKCSVILGGGLTPRGGPVRLAEVTRSARRSYQPTGQSEATPSTNGGDIGLGRELKSGIDEARGNSSIRRLDA